MSAFADLIGTEVDERETRDLALHVRQCSRRYRSISLKLLVLIALQLLQMGAGGRVLDVLRLFQ